MRMYNKSGMSRDTEIPYKPLHNSTNSVISLDSIMLFISLIFVFSLWQYVGAYKVLVAVSGPWMSHYQFGIEMVKALAAEGHEVTMITPFKLPEAIPNYEEVFVEFDHDAIQRKFAYIYSVLNVSKLIRI